MTAYRKVAISIPDDTYRGLERARAKLGQSRSEAVANAVREWLKGLDANEERRRYIEGYLRIPEDVTRADEAIVADSVSAWSAWEPGEPSRASERRSAKSPAPPRKRR